MVKKIIYAPYQFRGNDFRSVAATIRNNTRLSGRASKKTGNASRGATAQHRSQSRVRTRTRTPASMANTVKSGIGYRKFTKSRVSRKSAIKLKKRKGLGRFRYTEEQQGRMTSSTGQQGAQDILAYGTADQILSNSTTAGPAYGVSNLGYFSMNPNDYLTGSQLFTAGYKPANDRIFMNSLDYTMKLTNTENAACELTLYWCLAKKSGLQNFPCGGWDQALLTNGINQGVNVPAPAGGTAGVGGFPTRFQWGEKPFANKTMRENWKCLKKTVVPLASGSTETVVFNYNVDKLIKKDVIAAQGAAIQQNITVCCFYILSGQVVADKTGGGTNHRSTLAQCEVCWVSRVTTSLTLLKEQVANIDTDRIDVTIPNNALPGDQYLMDAEDLVSIIKEA